MPFPNTACSGESVPQPCCDRLWTQGNLLLDAVAEELAACIVTTSCCAQTMRKFVSLGAPEGWQSDILAVFLQGLSYTTRSTDQSGAMIRWPLARAQWVVYLMESCYPMGEEHEDGFVTPDDDALHIVNEHAYAHGEAIYRGATLALQPGGALGGCTDFILGTLTPLTPIAGNAGWTFTLSLGVQL